MNAEAYCETTLNYSNNSEGEPVPVTILNGRTSLAQLEYESCGFTLLQHESRVTDWLDKSQLEAIHVPEMEILAREFLGCDHAIVYSPLIRSPEAAEKSSDYAPIEFVHTDYTDKFRAMAEDENQPYHDFLGPLLKQHNLTCSDITSARRVVMLQFWRNIGPILPDRPFAICDAGSVPGSQLSRFFVSEYAGQRLDFEGFGVTPPRETDDNHWYTFPGLSVNEVVTFRAYDSELVASGKAFWTPHSAFRDPHAGNDAPARESVEVRVLCLFSQETT